MFIKNFDFITPKITLFYSGSSKHSSIISGLLSILIVLVCLSLTLIFSMDFLFKKHPVAFYYKQTIDDVDEYEINKENFFHYVTLYFVNGSSFTNTKYFRIVGIYNLSLDPNDYVDEYTYSHWIYEKCDDLDFYNINNIKFTENMKKIFNESFCIKYYYNSETNSTIPITDPSFFFPKIAHGFSSGNNLNYGILLKNCVNNTITGNQICTNQLDIDTDFIYLNNFYINFPKTNVQLRNYSYPFNFILKNTSFNIYMFDWTYVHLYFSPVRLRTTVGVFFDKIKYEVKLEFNNFLKEEIRKDEENLFHPIRAAYTINLYNDGEFYERTYKKIQDIAGSISGLVKLILILNDIIYTFFYYNFKIVYDFNDLIKKYIENDKGNSINNINMRFSNLRVSPYNNIKNNQFLGSKVDLGMKGNSDIRISNDKIYNSSAFNIISENNSSLSNINKVRSINKILMNKIINQSQLIKIKKMEKNKKQIKKKFKEFGYFNYIKSILYNIKIYFNNDFDNVNNIILYINNLNKLREEIISEEHLLKIFLDLEYKLNSQNLNTYQT